MKKLFILLIVLCIALTGCGKEPELTDVTDTAELIEYFGEKGISDWQTAAALYLEDEKPDLAKIDFPGTGSLYDTACTALICAFAVKPYGDDINLDYITPLQQAVAEPYELATYDLCLSLMALYVCDATPEMLTPAIKHLQEIQLTDGGFAVDANSAVSDPYTSAMVLNVITAYRDNYKDSDSRDGLLTYLGSCIENDNTIKDTTGKSSSKATAAVLSALIYAGIPVDGEISTALCKAISEFKTDSGYTEYKNETLSTDSTAEVFLTFATARRASIFEFFK